MGLKRRNTGNRQAEHVYNMTNIGVNIHSDMLCDLTKRNAQKQNGI